MTEKQIAKIAREFTECLLDGRPTTDMCYMVCSPLVSFLNYLGVECTLTEGELQDTYHHFWITLSDGRIIDPTADQFGLLNIWCRKQPTYYRQYTAADYNARIESATLSFHNQNSKP